MVLLDHPWSPLDGVLWLQSAQPPSEEAASSPQQASSEIFAERFAFAEHSVEPTGCLRVTLRGAVAWFEAVPPALPASCCQGWPHCAYR